MTTSEVFVNAVSMLVFSVALVFCLSNMIRFWRLRTYHTVFFYLMALFNLVTRCTYFGLTFVSSTSYLTLILTVAPSLFTLGVIISQVMMYSILHHEVSFYLDNRDQLKDSVSLKTSSCDRIIQVSGTVVTIIAFVFFGVEMALQMN